MIREQPPQAIDSGTMRPGISEQFAYVGGEFASNLAWNMVSAFLLIYYTDVALLPVASLGTLMLASRILDAIIDPLIGIAVDRTRTRWGQARPYLLFASIPFGVLCILCFAVPDWSPFSKVVYGYATFILLGICYSLVYIPYGAMQPMLARGDRITARISSWRAMATSLASIMAYSLILPVVGLAGPSHRARGFLYAATLFSVITVALYLLVFFRCHERFGAVGMALKRSLRADFRDLSANPIWRIIFLYGLVTFVRLGNLVSVAVYFATYVLHNPGMVGRMLPLLSIGILTGGIVASVTLRRLGTRTANLLFQTLSILLYLLMPQLASFPTAFLAAFLGANIVGGIVAATVFVGCTDAVNLHEARFGSRNEGLVFSSVSFGMKVGMAIGTAATAYALSYVGYVAATANAASEHVISVLFYYSPVLLSVLQMLIISFYRPGLTQIPTAGATPSYGT